MRIGFDVSQTGANKAGCGHAAAALIEHLVRLDSENHYLLYSNFGPDFWDPDHRQNTSNPERPNVERKFHTFSHETSRAFWEAPGPDFAEKLGRPDIIHSNNYYCPPKLPGARIVYLLHDLSFLVHPEFTTEANRIVCFNGVFEASMRADRLLAVSNYTRQHFLETFPHVPPEKVAVLTHASRFELVSEATGNADNADEKLPQGAFWLSVGTLEPRKNLRRLLQAYALLVKSGETDMPLALAGGAGWLEEALPAYIAELDISDRVHLLGYVSEARLKWLYQNCYAFVYPSLFEGFGLPVLEAMSQGAAVITSDASSLPEVSGDAAIQVSSTDTELLMEAMTRLQADSELRATLQQRALRRAAGFSWEDSARKLLDIYREVAAES